MALVNLWGDAVRGGVSPRCGGRGLSPAQATRGNRAGLQLTHMESVAHAAAISLIFLAACGSPAPSSEPDTADCVATWDKTCPAREAWEAVPCVEARGLEERGQPEARFHFDVVVSGDCGIDCDGVSVSIPRHVVEPFVRKALRSRDDCRRCELDQLVDFVARDVEADVAAAEPGAPPGWSYANAMLHPRRPFQAYGELSLESALFQLIREPGEAHRSATLLRRCPDGSVDETCERLLLGDQARTHYQEAAQRALDEATPPAIEEEP